VLWLSLLKNPPLFGEKKSKPSENDRSWPHHQVLPKNFDRLDDCEEKLPSRLDFASVQGLHARIIHNYHLEYQLPANNSEEFQRLQTNQPVPFGAPQPARRSDAQKKRRAFLPAVRTDQPRRI
jgi:hypothetical protein